MSDDHVNSIGENAPVRVRYKHAGVADEHGVHRPVCRPRDLKLQMVKYEKDVTCPHCLQGIEDFKNWMALQEAAGKVPEDQLPLEDKAWAILQRDGKSTTRELVEELNVSVTEVIMVLAKLVSNGSILADGGEFKVVRRG